MPTSTNIAIGRNYLLDSGPSSRTLPYGFLEESFQSRGIPVMHSDNNIYIYIVQLYETAIEVYV